MSTTITKEQVADAKIVASNVNAKKYASIEDFVVNMFELLDIEAPDNLKETILANKEDIVNLANSLAASKKETINPSVLNYFRELLAVASEEEVEGEEEGEEEEAEEEEAEEEEKPEKILPKKKKSITSTSKQFFSESEQFRDVIFKVDVLMRMVRKLGTFEGNLDASVNISVTKLYLDSAAFKRLDSEFKTYIRDGLESLTRLAKLEAIGSRLQFANGIFEFAKYLVDLAKSIDSANYTGIHGCEIVGISDLFRFANRVRAERDEKTKGKKLVALTAKEFEKTYSGLRFVILCASAPPSKKTVLVNVSDKDIDLAKKAYVSFSYIASDTQRNRYAQIQLDIRDALTLYNTKLISKGFPKVKGSEKPWAIGVVDTVDGEKVVVVNQDTLDSIKSYLDIVFKKSYSLQRKAARRIFSKSPLTLEEQEGKPARPVGQTDGPVFMLEPFITWLQSDEAAPVFEGLAKKVAKKVDDYAEIKRVALETFGIENNDKSLAENGIMNTKLVVPIIKAILTLNENFRVDDSKKAGSISYEASSAMREMLETPIHYGPGKRAYRPKTRDGILAIDVINKNFENVKAEKISKYETLGRSQVSKGDALTLNVDAFPHIHVVAIYTTLTTPTFSGNINNKTSNYNDSQRLIISFKVNSESTDDMEVADGITAGQIREVLKAEQLTFKEYEEATIEPIVEEAKEEAERRFQANELKKQKEAREAAEEEEESEEEEEEEEESEEEEEESEEETD